MKKHTILLLFLVPLLAMLLIACNTHLALASPGQSPPDPQNLPISTADHSQFEELKKDFKTAPEVTQACLECHNDAPAQIMANIHWTWEYKDPASGEVWGKK
ncbi:MAG TPA: cytochrome C, partial [Anaerolineae bacterium]|nr:cytochrome C [Anaerolineae bacterium]